TVAFLDTVTGGAGTGSANVTALSPITVNADVVMGGDITLTAADKSALGDILFVNGGVTVQSSGNISLNAGDSLFIDAGATVTAAANVTLRGDFGNADPAAGATIEIRGTINNGGAATV